MEVEDYPAEESHANSSSVSRRSQSQKKQNIARESGVHSKNMMPQPSFQDNDADNTGNETSAGDGTAATHILDEGEVPASATKTSVGTAYKKKLKALESMVESMKNSPSVSIASESI